MAGSFFYIPAKERLGIFFFCAILIGMHSLSSLYEKIFGPKQYEIIEVATNIVAASNETLENETSKDFSSLPQLNLTTASKDQLIEYGFSDYVSSNLIKYQQAGGTISSLSDLTKIYGVDKTHIEKISDKLVFKKQTDEHSIDAVNSPHTLQDTFVKPIKKEDMQADTPASTDLPDVASKRKVIDPNFASAEELRDIGLSEYATNNLLKYRAKGGIIYKTSDMLKIYGIDSADYNNIQAYISIPHKEKEEIIIEDTTSDTLSNQTALDLDREEDITHDHRALIDINFASEEELQSVYGIGPVISKGIVSYRERLGGYNSLTQIKEVYGVKEETFDKVQSQLTLSGEVTKMYIPALSFKEVLRHPYIDYETTKLLKNIYFEIYDDKIKELVKENKLDSRLVPYLHLDIPKEYLRN